MSTPDGVIAGVGVDVDVDRVPLLVSLLSFRGGLRLFMPTALIYVSSKLACQLSRNFAASLIFRIRFSMTLFEYFASAMPI